MKIIISLLIILVGIILLAVGYLAPADLHRVLVSANVLTAIPEVPTPVYSRDIDRYMNYYLDNSANKYTITIERNASDVEQMMLRAADGQALLTVANSNIIYLLRANWGTTMTDISTEQVKIPANCKYLLVTNGFNPARAFIADQDFVTLNCVNATHGNNLIELDPYNNKP